VNFTWHIGGFTLIFDISILLANIMVKRKYCDINYIPDISLNPTSRNSGLDTVICHCIDRTFRGYNFVTYCKDTSGVAIVRPSMQTKVLEIEPGALCSSHHKNWGGCKQVWLLLISFVV